ncbi:MAG: hypothetical protein COB76_00840 [Alphaproteobacteria bacterium]|nr:MAG: hypothetical protein COB76_00840 [Alphaproteobacteria bacterium]
MDVYFIAVQACGFLAFGLSLVSYQFKNQRTMFAIRVCGDLIWAIHYFLLSAMTPAVTVLIASLRTFLSVFVCPKQRAVVVGVAIISVCGICVYYGSGDWKGYLPALTAIIYGLSTYYHENYKISRILMGAGLLVWICIGVLFQSYAEVISSSVGLISLALGFYRHKKSGQV